MNHYNLNYEFYRGEDAYGGTAIKSDKAFKARAVKARAFVNRITFGRVEQIAEWDNNILCAICAVCDVFEAMDAADRNIKSVNNDGYAETYGSTSQSAIERKAYQAARMFLPPALLYAGADL